MDNLLSIWVLDSWWQLAQEGPGGIQSLPGNTLSSNHSMLAGGIQCGVLELVNDHPKLLGVSPYNHEWDTRAPPNNTDLNCPQKRSHLWLYLFWLGFLFCLSNPPFSPKKLPSPSNNKIGFAHLWTRSYTTALPCWWMSFGKEWMTQLLAWWGRIPHVKFVTKSRGQGGLHILSRCQKIQVLPTPIQCH